MRAVETKATKFKSVDKEAEVEKLINLDLANLIAALDKQPGRKRKVTLLCMRKLSFFFFNVQYDFICDSVTHLFVFFLAFLCRRCPILHPGAVQGVCRSRIG